MKAFFCLLSMIFVFGCASTSEVVETGPDTYMLSREGGIGATSFGKLKMEAIKAAGSYCKKQGKYLQVVGTQDSPNSLGNYAHSDIQFMCLSQGDSRLVGGPMTPVAPVQETIQVNKTE